MRSAREAARVDWAAVLDDVAYLLGEVCNGNPNVREPVGTTALARHLNFERSTVRGWLDGQVPKHHDGEALLTAWARLTGKARDFTPMCRVASLCKPLLGNAIAENRKSDNDA